MRAWATANERKLWWLALVGLLVFQAATEPIQFTGPTWFYIACLVGISIALGVIFWSHARFMRRIERIYDDRKAYAVLAEVEGHVDVAFATPDKDEAHRVFAAAEDHERTVTDADPARITLITCVLSGDEFIERLAVVPLPHDDS